MLKSVVPFLCFAASAAPRQANGIRVAAFCTMGRFVPRLGGGQSTCASLLPSKSPRPRSMSSETRMSLIAEIKKDHKELEEYYHNYKNAATTDKSKEWFNQFVWELCRHSVAEELIFYPLLESVSDRGRQYADEARQQHRKVKELLAEIQNESNPAIFDQKLDTLMENLRSHVNEEETRDLAFIAENVAHADLLRAGDSFLNRKKIVPTRPHTSVPEKPASLEAALGLLTAPLDKLRDLFTPFPKEASQ